MDPANALWTMATRPSFQLPAQSEFIRKLGMQDGSGSPRGDRTRLRNQMQRLFSATIQRPTVFLTPRTPPKDQRPNQLLIDQRDC